MFIFQNTVPDEIVQTQKDNFSVSLLYVRPGMVRIVENQGRMQVSRWRVSA